MNGLDHDNFSLSGLMQEGHKTNVTVIPEYEDNDDYDDLLDCAKQLAGQEISEFNEQSIMSDEVLELCVIAIRVRMTLSVK